MAVRGGNRDDIHAAFDETADVFKNSDFVSSSPKALRVAETAAPLRIE